MSVAAALNKAYSGEVRVFGRKLREYKNQALYRNCLTLLPQDVQSVFLCSTVREELAECKNAIKQLGLKLEKVHEFPMDGTNHMVIVLRKVAPTPAKFPRRYAKIKAAPL